SSRVAVDDNDSRHHQDSHYLPTRRSSDLSSSCLAACGETDFRDINIPSRGVRGRTSPSGCPASVRPWGRRCDSTASGTRAGKPRSEEHTSDSSHVKISYADSCLKKNNEPH